MNNTIERDNLIIRMKALGNPIFKIAEVLGVSSSLVTRVLHSNARNITAERPPIGMAVKTAFLIERTFGVWPSSESAAELSGRLADFQKAAGTGRAQWGRVCWMAFALRER
jgi:hypothetical protein